jgi:hypothetical protein
MSHIDNAKTYIKKLRKENTEMDETLTKKTSEEKNLKDKLEILKNDNKKLEVLIDEFQVLNQTWVEKNELLFEKKQEITKLQKELEVAHSKFESNRKFLDSLDE